MIVDWQHEPIKGAILHLDLKRIAMDKQLMVKVPHCADRGSNRSEAGGRHPGAGAARDRVRVPAADIPANVEVDVSDLVAGQVLRVKDLPHGGKLHFLTDEEAPVAHIVYVKEVVEVTPEAAVESGGTAAEPEVIKKGKQETEGAEPEKGKEKPEKGKEKK